MSTRNIFLSENPKKFTDKVKLHSGREVVMKRKEFVDKTNGITSLIILENICKGGLYQPYWNDSKNVGYGYEVKTSGFIVTYNVYNEKSGAATEKIEYFDESQSFLAFDLVIKICQMLSA